MNARHPRGVEGDVRHGASGVDVDGAGPATIESLQPSLDLGRSGNASVNSRVVQARKALATGRRQAVALSNGGGKISAAHAPSALGDIPPPVRRPIAQSPARARLPPSSSTAATAQGALKNASGSTDFRKMLDARKAEAAAADARMSAALHAAVRAGDPGTVQRLIDSGASVNTADDAGRTPLLNAVTPEVVSVLVAAGARYTQGTRGGTASVRQLELGEVEGGLGIFTIDGLESEPESESQVKVLCPIPRASEVSHLLERAALQEKIATTLPGSSTTAERAASLVGVRVVRTPLLPVSLRLPGELAKLSEQGRDALKDSVLRSSGLKQTDVAKITLKAGSIVATVHFKATASSEARDAFLHKVASGTLQVTMPDGSTGTAMSVDLGRDDANSVHPQVAAVGGTHAARTEASAQEVHRVLQPHEVMKLSRAGLPVQLPGSLAEQTDKTHDRGATQETEANAEGHQQEKRRKQTGAFARWGKIRTRVQSSQQHGGQFFVDTRAQEEHQSIAAAAFSGTRGVSQALAEAAMGGADGALQLAEANLMQGWEHMRAVRYAEVAVSRRLNRRAACRERCGCFCSALIRVTALFSVYLLWLGGGIFGLHWFVYCGSRCIQHLYRYLYSVPPCLRRCCASCCQSAAEPVAAVGVDATKKSLQNAHSAADVEQKYAVEEGNLGKGNDSASGQKNGKERESRKHTTLEQGTYVAGVGVVDSAAAARVAVAHTLATLGSGRFRSEGWGEDAEHQSDDDTNARTQKQRKQYVDQAHQPRPRQSSGCLERCSCGSGPGAVALHHALVYLVAWWLVCGIRLHFLPQVAPCYSYDPVPQLPFCHSVAPPERNTTITEDLFATGAQNYTGIITTVVSTEWTRSPPPLLDGDLLSAVESNSGREFLCWLWFRLRLLHLPGIDCLQQLGGNWMAPLFAASCIGLYLTCLAWLGDLFWIGPTVLLYLEGKEQRMLKLGQGRGVRAGWRAIALGSLALLLFGVTMSSWSVGGLGRP